MRLNGTYPRLGERDMLISYLPVKGPEGIDRVAVIIRDVSKSKQFEEALRESEKRYRGLFETMPDGFASVGMDKRIVEANPAFRAMLGYSREEILPLTYEDMTPKKWHDFEERIIREQVLTRGYSDPLRERIHQEGRDDIPGGDQGAPFTGREGRARRNVGVCQGRVGAQKGEVPCGRARRSSGAASSSA